MIARYVTVQGAECGFYNFSVINLKSNLRKHFHIILSILHIKEWTFSGFQAIWHAHYTELGSTPKGEELRIGKSTSKNFPKSKYEPFLLYMGRIDPSKGCEELFRYFMELLKQSSGSRKLVLLGKPTMPIPKHPDIVALGFVDEQTKWDALAACDLLVVCQTKFDG